MDLVSRIAEVRQIVDQFPGSGSEGRLLFAAAEQIKNSHQLKMVNSGRLRHTARRSPASRPQNARAKSLLQYLPASCRRPKSSMPLAYFLDPIGFVVQHPRK
jgi:hypothetical protein